MTELPRGIRLNNPCNLRHSVITWAGQSPEQIDPDFVEFIDAESGLRAGMKALLNYQLIHGLKTVREIIFRWAPPSDNNDTAAYIADVALRMGVPAQLPINLTDANILARLGNAIVRHENGPCPTAPDWYSPSMYLQGAISAGARAPESVTS